MRLKSRKLVSLYVAISLVSMSYISPARAVTDEQWQDFGDAMQFVLPLTGLGLTAAYRDKEGAKQWAWSGLTSLGTTTVLKGVYGKIRPNASQSQTSFPSGHTTAAFFGASFLDMRYGKWWGIPAYALAGLTAYSRVATDNHFVDDTLMGASIALFSSWYWVTPHEGAVSLIPFQAQDAYGVSFRVEQGGPKDTLSHLEDDDRWRYAIMFGPASQNENKVKAPTATGTQFNFTTFDEINDPTTTAMPMIERYYGRHLTQFSVEAFEARDTGQFSQPTLFNNTTFLPGEELNSAYRLTDVRLQYYYDLLPSSPVILRAGAGLSYQRTVVELATTTGTKADEARSDVWLPLVNASLGYQFTPRVSIIADLTGLSFSDQKQLDANVSLGYRFNRYWDAGIGYGIYEHDTDTSELSNKVQYDVLMMYVGYSFY